MISIIASIIIPGNNDKKMARAAVMAARSAQTLPVGSDTSCYVIACYSISDDITLCYVTL